MPNYLNSLSPEDIIAAAERVKRVVEKEEQESAEAAKELLDLLKNSAPSFSREE